MKLKRRRSGLGPQRARECDLGDRGPLTAEQEFLGRLPLRACTIMDVGAYQGTYSIFFASLAGPGGRVIAFEPDPESYQRILDVVRAKHLQVVDVRNVGVSSAPGKLEFIYPEDHSVGTAAADGIEHYQADPAAQRMILPVTSIDVEVGAARCPAPDFVKIDVEGLEHAVLRGMTDVMDRSKPEIFIEIHGWGMEAKEANVRRVVELLANCGYRMQHVESSQEITLDNCQAAREGHLYCAPMRKRAEP